MNNIILAITVNAVILLVLSWVFGGYLLRKIIKENHALKAQLQKSNPDAKLAENTDYSALFDDLQEELKDKQDRIKTLLEIQNSQNHSRELFDGANEGSPELNAYNDELDIQRQQTEDIIKSLQSDLELSHKRIEKMQADIAEGDSLAVRIFALERTERRLRSENKKLSDNSKKHDLAIENKEQQVHQLQELNRKLKNTITKLASASEEQLAIIQKLQTQINRAEQLEAHQQQLINELEQRLKQEQAVEDNHAVVEEIEQELENLRSTLKRTLVEKSFIEDYLLEIDGSIEKAKETEVALAKAKEEIASLEKRFPDYRPPITDEEEAQTTEETDNSAQFMELADIDIEDLLSEPLQQFWNSTDLPTISTMETEDTVPPTFDQWTSLGIGDNDYILLVTMDKSLAEQVKPAIVKIDSQAFTGSDDHPVHQTSGALGRIIANTLAEEMSNSTVGEAAYIDHEGAEETMSNYTLASEVMASIETSVLYIALLSASSE